MLNCIPPTKESLERIKRSTYCGASSDYKPTIVVSGDYAISPEVISGWDTNADVVFDNSTNRLYFLDKAGYVTEDASQAKSVTTWAKTKNGHKVMLYEQPYDASQAYQKNDVVKKDEWVYQSSIDDNVWVPDIVESRISELWTEITRLKSEQAIHSQLIDYVNKSHLPPIHRYDWWEIE